MAKLSTAPTHILSELIFNVVFWKNEEEEVEFTEDEEAIKNYLETGDPLPTELLDKIVTSWWKEEPFK